MKGILGITGMPVNSLSAYGRDEIIARALEAGAINCVVKPLSPTELVARIRGTMRRRLETSPTEPSEAFGRTVTRWQTRILSRLWL